MAIPSTYRVDQGPAATVKAPIHMPTVTPAPPFWYKRIRFRPCDNLTLSHGYDPEPALFEAAIGVCWGENYRSLGGQCCFSSPQSPATGIDQYECVR